MSKTKPDDTLFLDASLDPDELLTELRNKEDLFLRLVKGCCEWFFPRECRQGRAKE
jgi:hypothetical protein